MERGGWEKQLTERIGVSEKRQQGKSIIATGVKQMERDGGWRKWRSKSEAAAFRYSSGRKK